jgi:hypothetical protein
LPSEPASHSCLYVVYVMCLFALFYSTLSLVTNSASPVFAAAVIKDARVCE